MSHCQVPLHPNIVLECIVWKMLRLHSHTTHSQTVIKLQFRGPTYSTRCTLVQLCMLGLSLPPNTAAVFPKRLLTVA